MYLQIFFIGVPLPSSLSSLHGFLLSFTKIRVLLALWSANVESVLGIKGRLPGLLHPRYRTWSSLVSILHNKIVMWAAAIRSDARHVLLRSVVVGEQRGRLLNLLHLAIAENRHQRPWLQVHLDVLVVDGRVGVGARETWGQGGRAHVVVFDAVQLGPPHGPLLNLRFLLLHRQHLLLLASHEFKDHDLIAEHVLVSRFYFWGVQGHF